ALRIPLVTNADAEIIAGGEEARESLVRQVTLPVRWEESVRTLVEHGVNVFVEVGPGRVLTGLLRQIDRSVHVFNVEDGKSLQITLETLGQAQVGAAGAEKGSRASVSGAKEPLKPDHSRKGGFSEVSVSSV